MNVYIVWTSDDNSYSNDDAYYLIIAAHSPSYAKYLYASFGGWESEYFDKSPDGFHMHCHLIEKGAAFDSPGEISGYEESHGVDLIMAGVLQPMWRVSSAYDEYDYRQWNGFRKPKPNELEVEGKAK